MPSFFAHFNESNGFFVLYFVLHRIDYLVLLLLLCWHSIETTKTTNRRKPQNLTPPLSSDSAHSLSPRASPSASKRPSANGASDELPAKKQRISHYRRPSPPSSGYATTSSGERHASDNEDDRTGPACQPAYTAVNSIAIDEVQPKRTQQYRRPSPPAANNNAAGERHASDDDDRTAGELFFNFTFLVHCSS